MLEAPTKKPTTAQEKVSQKTEFVFTEVEGKVRQRGEKKMKENRIIAFVLLYDKLDSFFFQMQCEI